MTITPPKNTDPIKPLSDEYLREILAKAQNYIDSEMPALPVKTETMMSLVVEIAMWRMKAKEVAVRPAKPKKPAGRKPTKR